MEAFKVEDLQGIYLIKGSGAWENSNFGLKTDFLRYYHILTATCVYYCQANDECSQTNFNR